LSDKKYDEVCKRYRAVLKTAREALGDEGASLYVPFDDLQILLEEKKEIKKDTIIYGASDDLIEIEGEIEEEIDCWNKPNGMLLYCSDGTLLNMKYEKSYWKIRLLKEGKLFNKIEYFDGNHEKHSDVAYLNQGIKFIYFSKDWGKIGTVYG